MVLQANQNLWIFVFLRMYSPCDVKAKVRLLILEQLWSSKTKSSQIVDTYKHLIFREISLSSYLCSSAIDVQKKIREPSGQDGLDK
jgi:hypothetical protein